jgi:hypothetical protein
LLRCVEQTLMYQRPASAGGVRAHRVAFLLAGSASQRDTRQRRARTGPHGTYQSLATASFVSWQLITILPPSSTQRLTAAY